MFLFFWFFSKDTISDFDERRRIGRRVTNALAPGVVASFFSVRPSLKLWTASLSCKKYKKIIRLVYIICKPIRLTLLQDESQVSNTSTTWRSSSTILILLSSLTDSIASVNEGLESVLPDLDSP